MKHDRRPVHAAAPAGPLPDLSEFQLRDTDATDLFGVFLAVHALPGAILLLHATVGCKFKTQLQLVGHDRVRESHNQRLWTGLDDVDLIAGSGRRLVEFARTWYDRRKPSLFVVATTTPIELSGMDVDAAVEDLRAAVPCPVLLIRTPGWSGSPWRGYRRATTAVASLLPWAARPPDPAAVAIAGYVFDRFEADHAANLAELKRMLVGAGLRLAGTLFSGADLESLADAASAATVVALPCAHAAVPDLSAAAGPGRTVVAADLPVGVRGSAAFLRAVASAAGVPAARVEEAASRDAAAASRRMEPAASRLRGASAALFLDTPTAAAVHAFLDELGVTTRLVCLTDGEEADPDAFRRAAERMGVRHAGAASPGPGPGAAPAPEVLANPSRDGALDALDRVRRGGGPVPLVVGSSVQQAALRAEGTPVVVLGYPATTRHFVHPVPWMGFAGAPALAQRFLDAATVNLAF